MNVLFIGHFSQLEDVRRGASAAGDSVQRKIIDSLRRLQDCKVSAISQRSSQAWPKGHFFLFHSEDRYATFPMILNVPLVRDFWFGVICFVYIFRHRPDRVVQYNSYFFVNVFVLLASVFSGHKSIAIVQDHRVGSSFKFSSRIHDKISSIFLRYFWRVVPVSEALSDCLGLSSQKSFVFPGAMEHEAPIKGKITAQTGVLSTEIFTVLYAGALEKHNGIDKLVDFWPSVPENFHLVIYGRGSLEKYVIDASLVSPNVCFRGFASKDDIHFQMISSDFNICFRFGDGIDERFFFPSKFFSVNCYPGFSLVNDFHGVPSCYSSMGSIIYNDLSNLVDVLTSDRNTLSRITDSRQRYLFDEYNWTKFLAKVVNDDPNA